MQGQLRLRSLILSAVCLFSEVLFQHLYKQEQCHSLSGVMLVINEQESIHVGGCCRFPYSFSIHSKCKVAPVILLTEHHAMKAYGGVEV
jgi:hypothetical protein